MRTLILAAAVLFTTALAQPEGFVPASSSAVMSGVNLPPDAYRMVGDNHDSASASYEEIAANFDISCTETEHLLWPENEYLTPSQVLQDVALELQLQDFDYREVTSDATESGGYTLATAFDEKDGSRPHLLMWTFLNDGGVSLSICKSGQTLE